MKKEDYDMEDERKEALDPEILGNIKPFSGEMMPMETGSDKILGEGKALQKVETGYTTAVVVQNPRSLSRVVSNCIEEAELAASSFYYGWEVKGKSGKGWIEGPTIDLAMCVARNYGNCAIDVNRTETPTHFMMKGVFIDLETGFTCPRLFRQRKKQSLGGKMARDTDRMEDIVFQIGQSKAVRNAIIKAMPSWLIEKMIEKAKESVRRGVGENLAEVRAEVLRFFKQYGISQERVEASIGKEADMWSADHIVNLRGMASALKEQRISADELFPEVVVAEEEKEVEPEKKEKVKKEKKTAKKTKEADQDQEGNGQTDNKDSQGNTDFERYFEIQMENFEETLGVKEYQAVLDEFHVTRKEDVPEEERKNVLKKMMERLDKKNEN
jgi:hypothetical protein